MNKPSKIRAEPEFISAEELDRRFDDGEDVSAYFDWSNAKVEGLEKQRINLDLTAWMVRSLDVHANRRGVTRQALIKMWLADRLDAAG
ncbi:MAG: CopG family antitoxin [Pseudomonadota bacterium]